MSERHPDELDLLDLVEGELPRAATGSVAAHVEGCPRCTEAVRRLRAGRRALHASGVLQLSERARDEIAAAIDREPRRRAQRFRFWEPRRLGLVLGMTLVLVASVVAIAQWGRVGTQGDEEAGGDAASLAESGGEEGATAEEDVPTAAPESALGPVFVAGPARAVAAELRADGFDARVVDGEVVVRVTGERLSGAERAEEELRLQTVLAELPSGDVAVRVEP